MDENHPEEKSKSSKGYEKHSKKYWLVMYVIAAIVVYGLIYLVFIRKSSGGSGSFNY